MLEIKSPIKSIKIEIDGGWKKKPKNLKLDGSVSINSVDIVGEVSQSFSQKEDYDLVEITQAWLKHSYPDWLNDTCAIHINLEIINKELFDQLMTKKFYLVFRKNAKEWGKANKITKGSSFWRRLDGDNSYCEKGFSTTERYKQLNFVQKDKNIIECRIFPTFQKIKLSQSAVEFFYNLVNNYLGLRSIIN